MNPEIGNVEDAILFAGKQGRQFVLSARVDDEPALDAQGAKQAKVVHGKDGFAAEGGRGVFGN